MKMMKNKFSFILFISIFISFINLSAQNKADVPILNAIDSGDWFKVRDLYEEQQDDLSDYIKLYSGALLDYYFNNLAGVVEKVQEMYTDYDKFLEPNFFPSFYKMTDCLGRLGMHKEAYEISKSLLDQAKDQMDENSRNGFERNVVLYKHISKYSAPKLVIGNKEETIPFKFIDNRIYITIAVNGVSTRVLLDTGAGTGTISENYAKKLGLEISSDSLLLNSILAPIAVIDSMMIGETLITNLPFAIVKKTDEVINHSKITIGTDVIQLFPEFVLDYKNKDVIFKNYFPKRENTPRNLCSNQMPFVNIKIEGIPTIFLWDTGGNGTIIRDAFYEKHKGNFQEAKKTKDGVAKGVGIEFNVSGAKIPKVKIEIGNKIGVIKPAIVLGNFSLFDWFEVHTDGFLAANKIKGIDRLILSYQGMYFIAE